MLFICLGLVESMHVISTTLHTAQTHGGGGGEGDYATRWSRPSVFQNYGRGSLSVVHYRYLYRSQLADLTFAFDLR